MKELRERLEKILREEYGITTDEQLLKAVENTKLDIGIFITPITDKGGASCVT